MIHNIQEEWKEIKVDFEYTNPGRYEISNFGRLRFHSPTVAPRVLEGSKVEGYKVLKVKFIRVDTSDFPKRLAYMKSNMNSLMQLIRTQKKENVDPEKIKENESLLKSIQQKIKIESDENRKARSVYFTMLFHRGVAEYFIPKPSEQHTIVAHLDHDKLNNHVSNLAWMTKEENYAHQQKSPKVREEHSTRRHKRNTYSKVPKLTVTQVMMIKKLLREGKPIRLMVKQFKVSEMQIRRIKSGENWSDITID